jgi:hypothetical protein
MASLVPPVNVPPKSTASVVDYEFNWTNYLATNETISTATITAAGLTVNPNAETTTIIGGLVTFWLGGGVDQTVYDVICQITTNQGRTDTASFELTVRAP